jgi:hypothetical protein
MKNRLSQQSATADLGCISGLQAVSAVAAIVDWLQTSFRGVLIEFPVHSLFHVSIHLEQTEQSKGIR